MAGQRSTIEFTADGQTIAALTAAPAADAGPDRGKPLIAALHGGTYTARYYDVAGSAQGTFLDLAAAAGYPVACFDRPGYGGSAALPPAQNTFARQADLLADAIAQAAARVSARSVFLTGHSIGGMIALMIAAGDVDFRLTGLSVTGMGAVIRAGGPAQALASLPPDETIDLPYDQRDQVMFGPPATWTAAGVQAAHGSYAPTPVREQFAKLLTAAPFVDASIARSTGHSIDHHILGHALHLRQLAFAEECQLWASQPA
jgi:pimeloyl-ACP methyl ester carboxylesterase